MVSFRDIKPQELINKAAIELKKTKEVQMPEWAKFVKTGVHKERPPVENDWWQQRAASILRRIALLGPIGVSKLRKKYGGRQDRGTKPERFRLAGGKIIRVILQQLRKEGLIKQIEKGVHKGNVITPKGQKFLDSTVRYKNAAK